MTRPLIVGAGTCVMQAVIGHLGTIPGLKDRVDLVLSQVGAGGRPALDAELLARCSVLIEESTPWRGAGTLDAAEREALPATCAMISIPSLHFNSLWPLMVEDPRNRPDPGAPFGRLPFGMGDRQGLKIVQTVSDPAARRVAYDSADITKLVNIGRYHELETRSFFAREQGCDVRVAAYVMTEFRRRRLFYTHAHPTGDLLAFMLAQLFAIPALRDLIKLPYDQLVRGAAEWGRTSGVFAGEDAPIHPVVAKHFGLEWWRADLTYRWLGKTKTFDEWINFYLTFDPDHPEAPPPPALPAPVATLEPPREILPRDIPVGPFLGTLVRGNESANPLLLSGSTRVTRPVPFASGAFDLALSPYGQFFSNPQETTYEPGETLVACLRDATVIGDDGLVVHDGRIVADTFRNFRHGAASPMVATPGPRSITLHPGMPATTRRLSGPHFCGVAGLWHDYGHWIFGMLPRLAAYLQRRAQVPGLRLILPRLPATGFQAETLDLLGITPDCIEIVAPTERLLCDELHMTTAFDLWRVSPFGRIAAERLVSAWAAEGGIEAGLPRLHIPAATPAGRQPRQDPLFSAALAIRGFRTVELDGISLRRQIALMRGARFLVVEGGPTSASVFFAPSHCRVLEIFDPRNVQPMVWSAAAVSGLQYGYQVGALERPGGDNFVVGTQMVSWTLDRMLLDIAPPQPAAAHAFRA